MLVSFEIFTSLFVESTLSTGSILVLNVLLEN